MSIDKVRESKFELMRIVSMFLIIIYHIIYHSKMLENTSGALELVLRFIMALTLVHVSSFVLLSGYFQHNKQMKLSKAISLNNSVWFYKVVIILIAIPLLNLNLTKKSLFNNLMPINYDLYWFIKEYLILYLISPIINIVINNCDQNRLKKIIIALFLIVSFLPFITGGCFLNVNGGYSLYYMIFLYIVGAYINKYPLKNSYLLKKLSSSSKILLYITCYILFSILNQSMYVFGDYLTTCGELSSYFGDILKTSFLQYNNPLVLFQSISYFLLFESFKFKNKFINTVATTVFGIYLINENDYIKLEVYRVLNFVKSDYSFLIIGKIVLVAILIFIVCASLEKIRQYIFKFIYNLNISKKFRVKYRSYIESLGLKINW